MAPRNAKIIAVLIMRPLVCADKDSNHYTHTHTQSKKH